MTSARRTPRTGFRYLDEALEQPEAVLAFAHRGGAAHPGVEGLENTMAAFKHAYALGYRYLETDVHTSADGVLLAFHDTVLDRVTDQVGALAELPWSEVSQARIAGREPVPTLLELVEEFPEARFNIDIKSAGAVPVLAQFIGDHGLEDRTLIGSFSHVRLQQFRRLTGGRVPTSASPREVAWFRGSVSGRVADRFTDAFQAFQIPHRQRGVPITTPGLVRRAHATGKHVHVWTIDDAPEMWELLDRGVDGLMTDRTDILKTVLVASGKWRGPDGIR